MDDARLAICWAISDWLVMYAELTEGELQSRTLFLHSHGSLSSNKLWFPPEWLTGRFSAKGFP